MRKLRSNIEAEGRRLLRVLLVCGYAVSAYAAIISGKQSGALYRKNAQQARDFPRLNFRSFSGL